MADWKEVQKAIEDEIQLIWLDEPIELKKFRLGIVETGAGAYDQYFSTWVFGDGEIRALGIYCVFNAIEACERKAPNPVYSLEQCKDLFKYGCAVCAEYVAYNMAMPKIWDFYNQIVASYDSITSKEDFAELLYSYYCLINRLHLWIHHMFPWALGTVFPRSAASEIVKLYKEGTYDGAYEHAELVE